MQLKGSVIAFIFFLLINGCLLVVNCARNDSVFVKAFKKLHRGPPERPVTRTALVETKWLDQKLDNFNETESRTWQMRYLENREFFQDRGPMFIHLGGEWEISSGAITDGIIVDLAKEHKGILFYTEHRFYGKSRPLDSMTVENLKYLHVKQALADLANFISYQRKTVPGLANSKVIMSGGSYSATMVVWFKKLYPDLLDGGFASSAPIFAKVDFVEYKEVVGRALQELGSEQCYQRIKNGIAELESMLDNSRVAELKAMLKLCNNFDHHNVMDVWTLFDTMADLFSGIVQYQSEGDVPLTCNYLMSFETNVKALTNFWLKHLDQGEACLDATYKDTLTFLKDSSYGSGAARPWLYQTCNEYGWYQTSTSENQPFGTLFPLTYFTAMCADIYGVQYSNIFIDQQVANTNKEFGGFEPNVENIYMTHGGLDPWHSMGHGEQQGASVIPRTSHCADFGSISENDTNEMRASKQRLVELVRKWLL